LTRLNFVKLDPCPPNNYGKNGLRFTLDMPSK
jgi:hypothetical protein